LEVKLNDQERRAVGRLLVERKALLIETTEDTTRPDHARRAGLMELSVIASILGKLCRRDVMSIGASAMRRDNQDENRATIRMRMRRRGDYEGRA
jgi:hypothetical protein